MYLLDNSTLIHPQAYNPSVEVSPISGDLICNLWKSLYLSSSNGTNLIFSPYSVISALMMMLVGSSGDTQLQLANGLFKSGLNGTVEYVNQNVGKFRNLNQRLLKQNDGTVQLGNFIYSQQSFSFNLNYTQALEDLMKAKAKSVDFGFANKARTIDHINSDVSNATNGSIRSLLSNLEKNTVLLLINTLTFQGLWYNEFNATITDVEGEFWISPDRVVKTALMKQEGTLFPYYRDAESGTQAVLLGYIGETTSMVVIIPPENVTMRSYIHDQFNAQTFNTIIDKSCVKELRPLVIPRFKLSLEHKLKSTLRALGITHAFEPNSANFSQMSEQGQLYVSDVMQNVVIECDEKGTRAAAATIVPSVGFSATDDELKVVQFIANRPFLFAIVSHNFDDVHRDRQVLFAGVIQDPTV